MGASLQFVGAICAVALSSSCYAAVSAQVTTTDGQKPSSPAAAPPVGPPIIVTGSRIPRRNLTAVSPVTMVTGQEYKLEGAVLTEDVINQLPQVTPDQGAFIAAGAKGTSTVNLRDLGASRTLVLVNGRRLLPGDPTYPAGDINIIPSSLIKRVEVLTGGASSVYGSDAVSGVVNFILDFRLDGLRLDAQLRNLSYCAGPSTGMTQKFRLSLPMPETNVRLLLCALKPALSSQRPAPTLYTASLSLKSVRSSAPIIAI